MFTTGRSNDRFYMRACVHVCIGIMKIDYVNKIRLSTSMFKFSNMPQDHSWNLELYKSKVAYAMQWYN